MPAMNRKGPMGDGPMTGRAMGLCNPNRETQKDDAEALANTGRAFPGRGLGRGMGRGRGRGFNRRGF